jgi:hypothetical protein
MKKLELWQRLWLLFTVIWVALSGLHVATILALEEGARDKVITPMVLLVVVPAIVYLLALAWAAWRERRR